MQLLVVVKGEPVELKKGARGPPFDGQDPWCNGDGKALTRKLGDEGTVYGRSKWIRGPTGQETPPFGVPLALSMYTRTAAWHPLTDWQIST
jgi:hypothetical protein